MQVYRREASFLFGDFEEKTVGSFFRLRQVHVFVHLFNNNNLNYGRPKHTRNARTSSKTKNRRPEPRKHTKDPFGYLGVFHLDFFGTMRLFRKFLDSTKGSPFKFVTEWMLIKPKGSPLLQF